MEFETRNSMWKIRNTAERDAWLTFVSYRDSAQHALDLTRDDRAVMLRKARNYRQRAIRVSKYLNARQELCRCNALHDFAHTTAGRMRGWNPDDQAFFDETKHLPNCPVGEMRWAQARG